MTFTAAITREGDLFVAHCLEIEIASQGSSVEAARTNLRKALELYFGGHPQPSRIEPAIVVSIELELEE